MIDRMAVSAYLIPTEVSESDGTLAWDHTTLILVELESDGIRGMGYTYAHRAAALLLDTTVKDTVLGKDALAPPAIHEQCVQAVRNIGRPGLAAMAISALDTAAWDLKARILNLPLVTVWGQVRESVPVYGSGGFTSYSTSRLCEQMRAWVDRGILTVKMKVGRDPDQDADRVRQVREAVGETATILVDANGAYSVKQALSQARAFAESRVTWFEEPVSSDNLEGLRFIRSHAPDGMEITAGEYGDGALYFRRMLESQAVDVLQADATRCTGLTGLFKTAALCEAFQIPLSTHTAPALHLHAGCALVPIRHLEFFADHVRIERLFFEGWQEPVEGRLRPDLTVPGLGLRPKYDQMERFRIYGRSLEAA